MTTPDPTADEAAMLDAFRNQPLDLDADTRAQMGAVAEAASAAHEQFMTATDHPDS